MHRLALIALAGCGRIGFDAAADATHDSPFDVVPLGHDEDGDGTRDSDDTCPHVVGPQTDTDGDGVGDLCDPDLRPGMPDRIALFFTMAPGDQPFSIDVGNDCVWVQSPDSYDMTGDLGPDDNLYGHLLFPTSLGNARVVLGVTLNEVVATPSNFQNQIALAVRATPPNYFVELNQVTGSFSRAEITQWDGGTGFTNAAFKDIVGGLHPGDVTLDTIQRVNTGVVFNSGWPGQMYQSIVNDTLYQGASRIELNLNNLRFQIRYLIVITSP